LIPSRFALLDDARASPAGKPTSPFQGEVKSGDEGEIDFHDVTTDFRSMSHALGLPTSRCYNFASGDDG
jgi:hypothetical protein